MYKYFCNCCGERFKSILPERDQNGALNNINCPRCGVYDIYPDTPEGAKQSIIDNNIYEDREIAWEE